MVRYIRSDRVEETFGKDPYLAATMAVGYIRGLQDSLLERSVLGTLKHFVGHSNSEGGRNHASTHIPPRELRET